MSKRSAPNGFAPILILLGILILVGVAGGAYYLGRSNTSKLQPQNPVVIPQTLSPSPKTVASVSSRTIKSISFTKDCSIIVRKEGGDLDSNTTSFAAVKKDCVNVYPPQISSDGKYGAVEVRMEQASPDGQIGANNMILAYFADYLTNVNVYHFGAAAVKNMSFDQDNNLLVQLFYEGKDAGITKILLPKISANFDQVVDADTREIHYSKSFLPGDVLIQQ